MARQPRRSHVKVYRRIDLYECHGETLRTHPEERGLMRGEFSHIVIGVAPSVAAHRRGVRFDRYAFLLTLSYPPI